MPEPILNNRFYPFLPLQNEGNHKINKDDGVDLHSRLMHLFLQILSYLARIEPMSMTFEIGKKRIYVSRFDYMHWRTHQHLLKVNPISYKAQELVQELTKVVNFTSTKQLMKKFLNESIQPIKNDPDFQKLIENGFPWGDKMVEENFQKKLTDEDKNLFKQKMKELKINDCYCRIAAFQFMKTYSEEQIKKIIKGIFTPIDNVEGRMDPVTQLRIDQALKGKNLIKKNNTPINQLITFSGGLRPAFTADELEIFNSCQLLQEIFS